MLRKAPADRSVKHIPRVGAAMGSSPKVSNSHRKGDILRWAAGLSSLQVIEESKHGLYGRDLREIQERTGFSGEDWSRFLQVASRTIQRYLKEDALIDSALSERAILVAQIAERGRDVFGADDGFKMWLQAPNVSLGGLTPATLLDTTTGMHVVQAELTRIEHGVY